MGDRGMNIGSEPAYSLRIVPPSAFDKCQFVPMMEGGGSVEDGVEHRPCPHIIIAHDPSGEHRSITSRGIKVDHQMSVGQNLIPLVQLPNHDVTRLPSASFAGEVP